MASPDSRDVTQRTHTAIQQLRSVAKPAMIDVTTRQLEAHPQNLCLAKKLRLPPLLPTAAPTSKRTTRHRRQQQLLQRVTRCPYFDHGIFYSYMSCSSS